MKNKKPQKVGGFFFKKVAPTNLIGQIKLKFQWKSNEFPIFKKKKEVNFLFFYYVYLVRNCIV